MFCFEGGDGARELAVAKAVGNDVADGGVGFAEERWRPCAASPTMADAGG